MFTSARASFKPITRGMAEIGDLIVIGTYEEFVLGYVLTPGVSGTKKFSLKQSFATQTHGASVRSLAVSGKYLATGGADELIQLYDLEDQITCGSLSHHNGTVNTIAFSSDRSFLLSGGDDGVIAVVQTGSWFVEKLWKSTHHGKAVTGISVHPSGKLALSIGLDNCIVTWDLIKGRRAFASNASNRCKNGWGLGDVQWSPEGSHYAVFLACHVEVYSVSSAAVSHIITCCNRVTSVCFLQDNILLVGEDNGEASIHQLKILPDGGIDNANEELVRFQAHDRRVKCVKKIGSVKDGSCNAVHFVSACSSGVVRIWEWENEDVTSIAEMDCDCRITCMEFVKLSNEIQSKREHSASLGESSLQRLNESPVKAEKLNGKSRRRAAVEETSEKVCIGPDVSFNSPIKQKKKTIKRLKQKEKESKWVIKKTIPQKSSHDKVKVLKINSINAGVWNVST